MIHESKKALQRARHRGKCEHCGRAARLDPAHIFSVASGRIDADWNLVALCRHCHTLSHEGKEPRMATVLMIAANRCRTTPDAICEAVWWFRRQDKDASQSRQFMAMKELSEPALRLVEPLLEA